MDISAGAFMLSMDRMLPLLTKTKKGCSYVYLWTFTFKEVLNTKEASRRWNHFTTIFKRQFPTTPMLRVFELHMAEYSHGLHVHALLPFRLDVNQIRKLSERAKFGRIHTKIIDSNKGQNYLAKYLIKQRKEMPKCLRGMRLWAAVNFKHCKVINVQKNNFASYYCKRHLHNLQPDFYDSLVYVEENFKCFSPEVKKWQGRDMVQRFQPKNHPLGILKVFQSLYPRRAFRGFRRVKFLIAILHDLYFPLLEFYARTELYPSATLHPRLENIYYSCDKDKLAA